jgi:hypothetical protein
MVEQHDPLVGFTATRQKMMDVRPKKKPVIQIRTLPSSSTNSKKTLDFYGFWLFSDFLSVKNDVNVPSK